MRNINSCFTQERKNAKEIRRPNIDDFFPKYVLLLLENERDKAKNYDFRKLFPFVVYITTFRAFRLSRGILHLCQQGYADISLILYRSLLELRITLAYIEQDRENRTELFLDHYFIWEKWWMDSKTQGGRSVPGQERKEIMKEYNRVKAKYPNKYWWAGKNIEQIAKEAKVDTNIRNWYGYLSTHVHSCAHILDKFVRNNEIFFPSSIAPSIEYYDSALSSTIISFKSLMEKCLSVLGLSIPPDLQQVFNDIDKELKSCP